MSHGDGSSIEELVALYLAGAMTEEEARAFEERLASGCPDAVAAMREAEAAVRELAADAPPVDPPPGLKADLLTRLGRPPDPRATDRAAAGGMTGALFRFAEDGGFRPTRHAGVRMRLLHIDRDRGQFTGLIRLDPGAAYPAHPHDGPEECIVLDGELIVGDVRLRRGDYQRAEPGTEHVEQRTETGATLFVTAPVSLLVR